MGADFRNSVLAASRSPAAPPPFEVLPYTVDQGRRGLATLPPPSPGDVYLDFEGYPFAEGGLEYLLGALVQEGAEFSYTDWWAHDSAQERRSFEAFVDWVVDRFRRDRAMHIYHYGAYEVTALRRLMGRYGSHEDEIDELLRGAVFVDLYTVLRQGVRVGEPRYSLKNVERLYGFRRVGEVLTAGDSIVEYERWLHDRDGDDPSSSSILRGIRTYNRLDCESTARLAAWLRSRQREVGIDWIPRAQLGEPEQAPAQRPPAVLASTLLSKSGTSSDSDPERGRIRDLLAHPLEFHRREAKPIWWALYDRHAMTEEELVEDLDCLGGLERTDRPPRPEKRSFLHEYRFDPDQDTKLAAGDICYYAHDLAQTTEIASLDGEKGLVEIKLGPTKPAPPDRLSLLPNEWVNPRAIEDSIFRTVQRWHATGDLPSALSHFLRRMPPRLRGRQQGAPVVALGSDLVAAAVEAVAALDASTVCIQGPPGTGKTFLAARIIARLLLS